jgi:hypothetical protein
MGFRAILFVVVASQNCVNIYNGASLYGMLDRLRILIWVLTAVPSQKQTHRKINELSSLLYVPLRLKNKNIGIVEWDFGG